IGEWFEPALRLPDVDTLGEAEVARLLQETLRRLHEAHVVLDFTDHLSDRELYTLVARDILPSYEKKLARRDSHLHWDCANTAGDPETWLRYYASPEERDVWSDETGCDPPPRQDPPHRRRLPHSPL
ncbi:MAG: hypothetical protein AAF805_12165, partial [Planctomycetota bacterium]